MNGIRTGRNPFEIMLLIGCFLGALVNLLPTATERGAISETLPPTAVTLWYVGLIVCSGLVLVGLALRNELTSLFTERVGLGLLAGHMTGYAIAVFYIAGWQTPTIAGAFLLVYSSGCVWRILQITRDIESVVEAMRVIGGQR